MKNRFFFIGVFLISTFILYKMIDETIKYDHFVCETKKMELKEVVIYVSGRANDTRIVTNKHSKRFSIDIAKEISNKGFPVDYIDIKEGDSIIKEAGSNELTIKRKKKIAVYELNCDDW